MPWTGNDERARCRGGRARRLPERSTENATETAPSDLDELDYALSVTDDEALNPMIATDFSEYFGQRRRSAVTSHRRPGQAFCARVPALFDSSATFRRDRIRTRGGMATKAIPGNLAADPPAWGPGAASGRSRR